MGEFHILIYTRSISYNIPSENKRGLNLLKIQTPPETTLFY
jgi:hypothetical protein